MNRREHEREHELTISDLLAAGDRCRLCGCSDHQACTPPCSWVHDPFDAGPLCSACLPAVAALYEDLVLLEALGLLERYHDPNDEQRVRVVAGGLPEPSGQDDKQLDARWGD
jgi:hypothetical protein